MKKVAIIMGSDSDLPVVEKGIAVLREYEEPLVVDTPKCFPWKR